MDSLVFRVYLAKIETAERKLFMNYLAAFVLTIFAFPCLAATLTEQFSLMDINKDGYLSESEFITGMQKTSANEQPAAKPVPAESGRVNADKKKIVADIVVQTKPMLPYQVENGVTWTDIYAENDNVHYAYRLDMDLSVLPDDEVGELKNMMKRQVCAQVVEKMCPVVKNMLLVKGIDLITHYNDAGGREILNCRLTMNDCL